MTATNTPSPPADSPARDRIWVRVGSLLAGAAWNKREQTRGLRRIPLRRWLAPAVLVALAPKCLLCVAAYVAAGAAFRFGGPELCGAAGSGTGHWLAWLPALGLAVAGAGCLVRSRRGTGLPTRGLE